MQTSRMLASLTAATAVVASAYANLATIEVDSVATEVLGTPVAIHRMYARLTPPMTNVMSVSEFQIMVGSALFHHRDFESEGAISTELGSWNPYQTSTLMSAGDSYVILGGNAGVAANGSIVFSNWRNSEFANAQPTFHGAISPGVTWLSANDAQGVADASGRVLLGQFVTRREDAFTARLSLQIRDDTPDFALEEQHLAVFTLDEPADDCADDPSKLLPGQCGCGSADTDSDGDGAADCIDRELALVQRLDFTTPELALGFGSGSDIRVDGAYAIVGAIRSTGESGPAVILRRNAGKDGVARWIGEHRISGGSTASNLLDRARIAISGTRVACRVRRDSEPYAAIELRERTEDGSWPLVAEFLPSTAPSQFGRSIALRGDWLAIGSTQDYATPPSGRVELYRRDAKGWVPAATINRTTLGTGQGFGRQVALGDGVLAVSNSIAVFIYLQDKTGTWQLSQELLPPDGFTIYEYGQSLAIDGDVLVAGCPRLYAGTPHVIGGAVVYRRGIDGLFAVEAVLRPEELARPLAPSVPSGSFGGAVSISGDTIAVGGDLTGRAYVYRRGSDGAWRCTNVLSRNLTPGRRYGFGVALADGQLLVGAPDFQQSAPQRPWVDVFDLDPARFGDLDGDGAVGPSDLAAILEMWGTGSATEDLDGDGVVGPRDLLILLGLWSTP
jgi:hypothetical protein